VALHFETDPNSLQQYGLITEEAGNVYPELVNRNDAGNIMGVH
jgi:hypothetical protein